MARFIIEGTWNGRVVHRSVHPESSKALLDWAGRTNAIKYRDGTTLFLVLRDLGANEQVAESEALGYGNLIADCARYDVDSVEALIAAERLA